MQFPMNLHGSLPCLLTLCPERRGSARDTPSISRTPGDSVFGPHLLGTSWPSMGSQPPWAVRILPLRKLSCEPRGVGWRVGSRRALPGPGGWLRAAEELRHRWSYSTCSWFRRHLRKETPGSPAQRCHPTLHGAVQCISGCHSSRDTVPMCPGAGPPLAGSLKESEVAQLCPTLCNPMDCNPLGSSIHGIFQARVLERVAIYFLLQEIFPIQGSKPGLAHCRQTLYHLSLQGRPS